MYAPRHGLERGTLRKVPEVTLLFWLIKLLTTAMGEASSDFFVNKFNPYVVVLLGFVGLAAALVLQLRCRRYIPWVYWLVVVMVAVFGTMAADVTHVALGVPYFASTFTFALVLGIVLFSWARAEKTLSIHSVFTLRRELFYWLTVLSAFALGTAAGDMLAYSAQLGFFYSGVVFLAIILIPLVGYSFFKWNEIFCFWFAYIMTRPLGASFADWTGKPKSAGALGWGDGHVALLLTVLIAILVFYASLRHEGNAASSSHSAEAE